LKKRAKEAKNGTGTRGNKVRIKKRA
jgi:hypothetical protein